MTAASEPLVQLGLNVALYVVGYAWLTACRRIDSVLRPWLAYVVGTAAVGTAGTLCIVMGLRLHALSVAALVAAALVTLEVAARRWQWGPPWRNGRRELALALGGAAVVAIASLLISTRYLVVQTTDSYFYQVNAHLLASSGTFPKDMPGVWGFTTYRMSLVPSLMATANMLGSMRFFTLFPLTALALVGMVAAAVTFLLRGTGCPLWLRLLLAALAGSLLAGHQTYLYHAFYLHSSMLTAAYLTGALIVTAAYHRRRHSAWMLCAGLLLGAAIQTRTEILSLGLLWVLAVFAGGRVEPRHYAAFLVALLLTGVAWGVYRLFLTGLGREDHSWGAVDVLALCAYGAGWVAVASEKTWRWLGRIAPWAALGGLFMGTAALGVVRWPGMLRTLELIGEIIYNGRGQTNWGLFWIAGLSGVLAGWLIPRHQAVRMACWLVTSFWLARVVLYALPVSDTLRPLSSGSRILLHVAPSVALATALVLGLFVTRGWHELRGRGTTARTHPDPAPNR